MDIGAFGKGKGKQGKDRHGKGKGKGKQRQQGQQGQQRQQGRDRSTDKDKNKDSIECWNCGKRGHFSKDCWSKKNTNRNGSKGMHKSKNAMDAHNLDSTKPASVEPEVEIGGFDMSCLDVDALQHQESEWIKIGVDTCAGKTAWPQSVTYGKKLPGHVDLTFRTATGELVKSGERLYVEGCDDWGVNLRVRGVQAPVCKPLLSVGECTAMGGVTVLYGDKGYMFHKGSSCEENRCADPEGDERFTKLRLYSCVQREQCVQHQHETEKKTRLMQRHCPRTQTIVLQGLASRVRTRKTG